MASASCDDIQVMDTGGRVQEDPPGGWARTAHAALLLAVARGGDQVERVEVLDAAAKVKQLRVALGAHEPTEGGTAPEHVETEHFGLRPAGAPPAGLLALVAPREDPRAPHNKPVLHRSHHSVKLRAGAHARGQRGLAERRRRQEQRVLSRPALRARARRHAP
jgi:hypothetical protein